MDNKSFQELFFKKIAELTKEIQGMKKEIIKLTAQNANQINRHDGLVNDRSNGVQRFLSIEPPHEDPIDEESLEMSEEPIYENSVEQSPLELSLELPIELPISNERDLKIIIDWIKEEGNRNVLVGA